jgi:hypothetical protein
MMNWGIHHQVSARVSVSPLSFLKVVVDSSLIAQDIE